MTEEKITDSLREIIKPYLGVEVDESQFSLEADLINDLKINSAHIVDIIIDIETTFDIIIDDESINQITSIGDAIKIIEKLVNKT